MNEQAMWQAKVLAYLHDPAVKALVLMRGESHEAIAEGVIQQLFGEKLTGAQRKSQGLDAFVKQADHWAAAADRPSLPMNLGGKVVFATDPQVIHPLTGKLFRVTELATDAHLEAVKAINLKHFEPLVVEDENGEIDWRKTFLSLWRFASESPAKDLGALWNLLPADTRSPDHSIWEHLKLTSAFAGAMAAGEGGPALLLVSFGPVQGFISQARSVSDLWAGSHLLSRIAWEGIRIVCKGFGPDSVLFPDLHGVAVTDLWLKGELGGWHGKEPDWTEKTDDTNPLFAAALPNRFVALVPAQAAQSLARKIETVVRDWAKTRARAALEELLKVTGPRQPAFAERQIERQFVRFPEVHWVAVPWHLAGEGALEDGRLKELLARLGADPAYLDRDLEGLLRGEITVEDHPFFRPNAGTAYSGLYEALERLHAAAKVARPFDGEAECGYRCTLCGEREWLTDDETLLFKPTGERKEKSLWAVVAREKSALAKEGEHLCGVCALKRTWPRLFVKETASAVPELAGLDRFVLSTRAVAISTSIWRWLDRKASGTPVTPEDATKRLQAENRLRLRIAQAKDLRRAALPRRLFGRLRSENHDADFFKALPALIDSAKDADEATEIAADIDTFLGAKAETYYALVLMDGDKMGAWLAGEEGKQQMERRFHTETLSALRREGKFDKYLGATRPASPARHQAISTALNGFALNLARVVVEDLFMGKLIYAGGDDLMAMVAVHDLPGLMLTLRCAYSGVLPEGVEQAAFWQRVTGEDQDRLRIRNGFALLNDWREGRKLTRMFRLMGGEATASIGAVIAHHQAPLARVLRDLRAAEKRAKAKNGGDRDAFCITLTKRAGGTTHLIGKWNLDKGVNGDMALLVAARDLVARNVSRQAVYLLTAKLRDFPSEAVESLLRYQFNRQAREERDKELGEGLTARLAIAAVGRPDMQSEPEWRGPNRWLRDMLLTAEFLAREGRVGREGKED